MKTTKKILGILLACLMLVGMLSMGVFAAEEGTKENPINANNKWFGFGVNCFLLNPTLTAGDTDGIWYTLTADAAGILQLENKYQNVDYQIYAKVNGQEYWCYENGAYNMPMTTLPVTIGDVITLQVIAQDTSLGGNVALNAKIVSGENDPTQTIKMKSAPAKVYVAAGATVYYQDDTTNAAFAAMGMIVSGDTTDVTAYTVANSSSSSSARETPFTNTDGDGAIEFKLGGAQASTGAPAVKPCWAIENKSNKDKCFVLTLADNQTHECVYDDNNDADCNTCGAIREIILPCEHAYDSVCDADCNLCGETREAPHSHSSCSSVCVLCLTEGLPTTTEHQYDNPFDYDCNVCGGTREAITVAYDGGSISEDVTGLAMQFSVPVDGMTQNGTTAVYDNATIAGYKLVGMGAVVSNQGDDYYDIEDADGVNVINVPAVYLYDLTEDTATFAIRIINIPEEGKDTLIRFRSYFIYEDEEGVQHTVYGHSAAGAYSWYI